jgi:putative tryptophan/tyrosine transport system substrate-binding protein
MKRREFIAGLGAAAAWPLAVGAQQTERMRRIGVLMSLDEADPEGEEWLSSFTRGLAELGWIDGRTARMDVRWAAGSADRARMYAKELIDLLPDVLLADSTAQTAALQRETRTIPIVFTLAADPIGAHFVASLPRPGGNITGFTSFEAEMSGKWLELLTEIAPSVKRVALLFNPDTAPRGGSYFLPTFEAAARSFRVTPIGAPVRSDDEIEAIIVSLGTDAGGGLVSMPDTYMNGHRATTIRVAAQHNVPAVYNGAPYVRDGGLLSYGLDFADIFRRSAAYVDRILRGAKPADLPVQLPTKFEMAVNLKTAKALGLAVPQSILLSADEVIE